MTYDYIADQIGVAKSTIQRYAKGSSKNPKIPVIDSIARILKVNPAWLCGKSDDKYMPVKSIKNHTTINVYGRVAAGIPIEAIEDIIDTEDISEEMARWCAPFARLMGL